MSLQFNELSLTNFGPYRSVPSLDVTTTDDAPAVLIYGENTVGKTTLFSAMRWCLYGTFQPQQTPAQTLALLPDRLNRHAERAGERHLEVRLRFTADGQVYNLARRAEFGDTTKITTDLRIGSTVVPQAAVDMEIGRLLHPKISEFFLFDAELMTSFYERLQTDRERAMIRESIEKVLGVPALQLAENDIATLAEEAAGRQAKAAKQVSEADAHRKTLLKCHADLISHDKSKREGEEDLQKARTQLDEINATLKAVDGLQGDIREQETLDAQVESGKSEERQILSDMKRLLAAGWVSFAVPPLEQRAADIESRNSKAQAEQARVNDARTRVAVLEDRLRGGVCPACKQDLPAPDASTAGQLAQAKHDLDDLLAQTGGTVDLALERKVRGLIDRSTPTRYTDLQKRLNELRALQYQRQRNLDGIKDRLQGHDAAEIRGLGQRRTRIEASAKSLVRTLEDVDKKITGSRTAQDRAARALNRLPGADPKIVLESNFFGFTRSLLTRAIQQYREQTRQDVEREASNLFRSMISDSSAYGGLRISPDYRIELLDPYGRPRETSEGGKQLVALSLIGALKQAAVRGGPVVLDSPLARLDLGHRASVLQTWVEALNSQVMLFVQSGELTQEDARKIMGNSIGKEYRLVRPTNDPELVEIEALT